jgi:hypothetical protein
MVLRLSVLKEPGVVTESGGLAQPHSGPHRASGQDEGIGRDAYSSAAEHVRLYFADGRAAGTTRWDNSHSSSGTSRSTVPTPVGYRTRQLR